MSLDNPFPAWMCSGCKLWQTCGLSEHQCSTSELAVQSLAAGDVTMPLILSAKADLLSVTEVKTPGDLFSPAAYTAPTNGGYGKGWALYDSTGTLIPASKELPAGHYLLACPKEGVVLSNIQAPKAEWDTMSYQAGLNATPEHPDVVKVEVTKHADGKMTQTLTFKDGSQQFHSIMPVNLPPEGDSGEAPDVREKTLERVGSGWRRRPRTRALFDIQDMPKEKWVWMVMRRNRIVVSKDCADEHFAWGDFHRADHIKPFAFKSRVAALRRMLDAMDEDGHNVALGIVSYEVQPHFIGYVPSSEPWYAETYTRQSKPSGPVVPAGDVVPSTR